MPSSSQVFKNERVLDKSPRFDQNSTKNIRPNSLELTRPLQDIFHRSFEKTLFLYQRIIAKISHIFENDDEKPATGYWPLYLLRGIFSTSWKNNV